ncbi:MAG TPA: DegT/DnrJ/EryC1/StrS family aminotransferase [Acidimicrobiales bacterium]|nr:DegT/DnrJ/EryC1/StrS family aminotransferase [Acidimicrobiales bacterium]
MRQVPLDFGKGAALLGDEERAAVDRVMRSRSLFRYYGPDLQGTVAAFEAGVRAQLGVGYAVAVSSGTAALRCALAALGIGPGARVVVPAFTFIATVNAVVAAGATPVFAEVDDTLSVDPGSIPAGADTIIAVHIENVVGDMDALLAAAGATPVVEDAAQAFGATYRGRAAGAIGALGCFSLQLEKNITAGEGGVVTTGDERLYLRASRYQDQGGQFVTSYASSRGEELTEPFAAENLRMGEVAGAIAGVQLGRLPSILGALRASKRRILDGVGTIDGLTPRRVPDAGGDGGSSCMWFLPDQAAAKRFGKGLVARGVPCAQMYRGEPVYWNPAVLARRTATGTGDWVAEKGLCPRTEALVARNVIVPIGVRYTPDDCDEIAGAIRAVAAEVL